MGFARHEIFQIPIPFELFVPMIAVTEDVPYEKGCFLLLSTVEVYCETIVETLMGCTPHLPPSTK